MGQLLRGGAAADPWAGAAMAEQEGGGAAPRRGRWYEQGFAQLEAEGGLEAAQRALLVRARERRQRVTEPEVFVESEVGKWLHSANLGCSWQLTAWQR